MYDPMTVAHEIRWPWKNKHGYRDSIFTIWHVDPEKHTLGTRRDDSCGWFSPPYTEDELVKIKNLAKAQYSQILAKKVAYDEGKSYAYICYNQECYGAIYWLWRAMKRMNKKGWQFGKGLTNKEINYVHQLAFDPNDNFQRTYMEIKNYDQFEDMVISIWRCFRRFYRPWYKHPRWHLHHWKIQFRPWQSFKRRYLDKCSECGKRGFTGSAYSDWGGSRIWCHKCNEARYKDASLTPKPLS